VEELEEEVEAEVIGMRQRKVPRVYAHRKKACSPAFVGSGKMTG
jgi:hypothetical protein